MQERDLTAVERRVQVAFARGERVDLRVGDHAHDDPANSANWGPQRAIRAEAITSLLPSGKAAEPGHVAALRVAGLRIEGRLDLDYAQIFQGLLFNACDFPDGVGLYDTRTRHLSFHDCRLSQFSAANAVVDGNLRISGSTTTGVLALDGAHITGFLSLDGARLANSDGPALAANRIQVDDHIWMREGFAAEGEVVLRAARIGGDLDLRDARLANPGGNALSASRMRVDGDVLCQGLRAAGQVRVGGSSIAGHAYFDRAHLSNPGDVALAAYHLQVGASLYLDDGFTTEGAVDLAQARIGGRLSLRGARLDGAGQYALSLGQAQANELDLRTAQPPEGLVEASHAVVGILDDDLATWPAQLRLDGLRYDRIQTPLPARQRVPWLLRDEAAYVPQPFEQLAASYRAMGQEDQARTVLLVKEQLRHRTLPWYAQIWGAIQDAAVGYGYRPLRAGLWLLGLLLAGSLVFSVRRPARVPSANAGAFNPVIFTLDHLLPVINFGQGAAFTPTADTQWVGYGLTAAGWILATTIATGVTRSVNRS